MKDIKDKQGWKGQMETPEKERRKKSLLKAVFKRLTHNLLPAGN